MNLFLFPYVLPCSLWPPMLPETRLVLGRSRFLSCAETERHSPRVTRALQGSVIFVRSSVILSRNKMMPSKDREFTEPCAVREITERAPSCLKTVPCH